MKTRARAALLTTAVGCASVLLVACGDDATPAAAPTGTVTVTATATPTAPATSAPPATTDAQASTPSESRCTTAELTGALTAGEPGAGQRYAELVLTNTGAESCEIFGYGGAQLVAASGEPIPTDLVRTGTKPPETVTLAPGESASSTLHWSAVPGDGDADGAECQPEPATLAVIPPDETTALDINWTFGPVCEAGHIDQLPYVAG